MGGPTDLVGRTFGRWTVVRIAEASACGRTRWWCRCECGVAKSVQASNLLQSGHSWGSKSCGCWNREIAAAKATHGHTRAGKQSPTYSSWAAMTKRCTNPKHKDWHSYGGRGVTVCERWRSFEAFLADMGEKPHGMSIERLKNDVGYEPGNCAWVPMAMQSKNRRPYAEWKRSA